MDECTVESIVEKVVDNLSSYIESMPTGEMEILIESCKDKDDWWFKDLISSAIRLYAQIELKKRKNKNE